MDARGVDSLQAGPWSQSVTGATMGSMLREVFAEIVNSTSEACRSFYGERLRGVAVFGSVARERMRHDSDIDLLVVADPLPTGRPERRDEFRAVELLIDPVLVQARERGVTTRLSPFIRTFDELGRSGFVLFDIACDGVVHYDPRGELAEFLAGVRGRLERRGADGARYAGLSIGCSSPTFGGARSSSYDGRRARAQLLREGSGATPCAWVTP